MNRSSSNGDDDDGQGSADDENDGLVVEFNESNQRTKTILLSRKDPSERTMGPEEVGLEVAKLDYTETKEESLTKKQSTCKGGETSTGTNDDKDENDDGGNGTQKSADTTTNSSISSSSAEELQQQNVDPDENDIGETNPVQQELDLSMNRPPLEQFPIEHQLLITPVTSIMDDPYPSVPMKTPVTIPSGPAIATPAAETRTAVTEAVTTTTSQNNSNILEQTTTPMNGGNNHYTENPKTPNAPSATAAHASTIKRTNKRSVTTPSKEANTSKLLAALFGNPGISGDYLNNNGANLTNLASQHDYTLVGDSPYETTFDPQSPFYYNRVYGQLYITTTAVMFRGKAFGPIGAIPYERRLLLPFFEVSSIEAYKTTSIKITMNDGENFVFKSFADREAVVEVLRQTREKALISHGVMPNGISSTSDDIRRQHSQSNTETHKYQDSSIPIQQDSANYSQQDEDDEHRGHRRRRSEDSNHSYNDDNEMNEDTRQESRFSPSPLPLSQKTTTKGLYTPTVAATASISVNGTSNKANNQNHNNRNEERSFKTPKTNEKRSPRGKQPQRSQPRRMSVNSLRLSISDDVDDENDGEEITSNAGGPTGPRRLFDMDPNSSMLPSSIASMMLSPPRTTISQRKQPKTPQVVTIKTPKNNSNSAMASRNGQVSRLRDSATTPQHQNQSGKSNTVGTLAPIPSIPTVPLLDTPEPVMHTRIIKLEERRATGVPLPIPEIDKEDLSLSGKTVSIIGRLSPKTPISNQSSRDSSRKQQQHRDPARDARLEQELKTALRNFNNDGTQNDRKVALEPTKLPNCTLDDWFDLFFSDDAVFSLARYQLEHVGDRDVSFRRWRRKHPKSPPDGAKKNETEPIPELEREISFVHPISGSGAKSLMGLSEAETFRVQSFKRYGNHGAIINNVTTVKGVPMSDCFRIEDRWIIEKDPPHSLKLSVSFRIVFVKRTMFKGIIQKNTISETQEWFRGYANMLHNALNSPEYQDRKRQRRAPPCSSVEPLEIGSPSSCGFSQSTNPSIIPEAKTSLRGDSPQISVSPTCASMGAASRGSYQKEQSTGTNSPTSREDSRTNTEKLVEREADGHRNNQYIQTTNPISSWTVLLVVATCGVGLFVVVVALWIRLGSVVTSLSLMERHLGELQSQNSMLLSKLEEFAVAMAKAAHPSANADVNVMQQ